MSAKHRAKRLLNTAYWYPFRPTPKPVSAKKAWKMRCKTKR